MAYAKAPGLGDRSKTNSPQGKSSRDAELLWRTLLYTGDSISVVSYQCCASSRQGT